MSDVQSAAASPQLRRALAWAVLLVAVLAGMYMEPRDDGLRHVGHAFTQDRSWGDVYPHSQFALHGDYDPWGGYDFALSVLARVTPLLGLSQLAQQLLVLKLLSVCFAAALLGLCVARSKLDSAITDPTSLLIAVLALALVLSQPVLRAGTLRPFSFGTLLLLYSVGRSGALRGFLASAVTLFMYPYLAWLYTGPVIVAHALKGSRSFAVGSAAATAIAIALQPVQFWRLLVELVRSDSLRSALSLRISEFQTPFEQPALLVATVLALVLLVPQLPSSSRVVRTEHVIMLLFVPVSLRYVRYFLDVQLTLLWVAYGADAVRALRVASSKLWTAYRDQSPAKQERASSRTTRRSPLLRPTLFIGYTLVAFAIVTRAARQHERFEALRATLDVIPEGSLVLSDFNQQYGLLFTRPDLSVVPSCEVGFASPAIWRQYLGYFNDGEVCTLARKIDARFFLDKGALYLHPRDVGCLRLAREERGLRVWRVVSP